jgi:hypothetical protein
MKSKIVTHGVLIALLIVNGSVLAEELPVERYVELSIARLELAKASWTATHQPPTTEALASLLAQYGIEPTDYLAYGGANREAIDAYLVENPEIQQRINVLSADIDQAITE